MGAVPQPRPWAELELEGKRHPLRELWGEEMLSQPFRFRVAGYTAAGDRGRGAGAPGCTVRLRWGDGLGGWRCLAGQLTAWRRGSGAGGERDRFEAVIEPRLARLGLGGAHRFFPRVNLEELTRCWLAGVGYAWADPVWRVSEAPAWRRQVLQAGASDLLLLQRLWAQAGVTLAWQDGVHERPLLTDTAAGFPQADGALRLPGGGAGPGLTEPGWCVRLQETGSPRPVPPGLDDAVAVHLARMRRQAQAARRRWLALATRQVGPRAGLRTPVLVVGEGGDREIADWGRWYLITRVRHSLWCEDDTVADAALFGYRAELEAVPEVVGATALPYRPPEPAQFPQRQPVPARICTDGGRLVAGDERRSGLDLPESVVRLLPLPRGAGRSGWHAPLVDGERVLVTCLDGDPDAPVILGSLPVSGQRHPAIESGGRVAAYTTRAGRGVFFPGAGYRGDRHSAGAVLDAGDGRARALAVRGGADSGHRVALDAGAGPLELLAGPGGLRERAGARRRERVGGSRRVSAKSGIAGRSERATAVQAAGPVRLGGAGGLAVRSGRDLHLRAGDTLRVLAGDGTRLRTRRGDGDWQVERGDLRLVASGDVSLRSRNGTVTLRNASGSAGIAVDADGVIRIWGWRVVLDAEDALRLDAEVHYRGGSS